VVGGNWIATSRLLTTVPRAGSSGGGGSSSSSSRAPVASHDVSVPGPAVRDLTEQLEETHVHLVPTPEQEEKKRLLLYTLKPLFEKHTGGVLQTFGSCENGFWMNGSDVDACLIMKRCVQRQSWKTKLRLLQCLVEMEQIGSAQIVPAARVPIAKIRDTSGEELCDVSVNNVAALENSRFVGALSRIDPRTPKLGRFIKHWASRRRINNRSEGTLSTYTLILQLFFFLQTRDPPVLPLVTDILTPPVTEAVGQATIEQEASSPSSPPRWVNAFVLDPEMDQVSGTLRPLPFLDNADEIRTSRFPGAELNRERPGELLRGFFQLWGQQAFRGGEEGSGTTVLIFNGTQEENDLGVLAMRCPLTGKNVNPFTVSAWRSIHAEFERAASLINRGRSLDELCEAAPESPVVRGPVI